MKLLVVDDDVLMRSTLKAVLRRAFSKEPTFFEAANAHDAVETFEKSTPDLVFLDMELEGGPGGLYTVQLLKKMRPSTHVVLVTGLAPEDPRVKAALSRGASAHLRKPVRAESIQKVLVELGLPG